MSLSMHVAVPQTTRFPGERVLVGGGSTTPPGSHRALTTRFGITLPNRTIMAGIIRRPLVLNSVSMGEFWRANAFCTCISVDAWRFYFHVSPPFTFLANGPRNATP